MWILPGANLHLFRASDMPREQRLRVLTIDDYHRAPVLVGSCVTASGIARSPTIISQGLASTEVWTRFSLRLQAAQFEAMSEADKLARPGFEEMVAGVAVGATTVRAGAPQVPALDYGTLRFYPWVANALLSFSIWGALRSKRHRESAKPSTAWGGR